MTWGRTRAGLRGPPAVPTKYTSEAKNPQEHFYSYVSAEPKGYETRAGKGANGPVTLCSHPNGRAMGGMYKT